MPMSTWVASRGGTASGSELRCECLLRLCAKGTSLISLIFI